LVLTDEVLQEFDSRYKVVPPLRSELDRAALLQGVLDNTIDCITSDHNPIDIEYKKMEFDTAKYGTIGLESAFGALQAVLPTDVIVAKLTAGKSVFKIKETTIAEGQPANITLFTPQGEGQFEKSNIRSKSKNSAFLGVKTQGKVYGIYNNNQLIITE
jgi:dihydroorotase